MSYEHKHINISHATLGTLGFILNIKSSFLEWPQKPIGPPCVFAAKPWELNRQNRLFLYSMWLSNSSDWDIRFSMKFMGANHGNHMETPWTTHAQKLGGCSCALFAAVDAVPARRNWCQEKRKWMSWLRNSKWSRTLPFQSCSEHARGSDANWTERLCRGQSASQTSWWDLPRHEHPWSSSYLSQRATVKTDGKNDSQNQSFWNDSKVSWRFCDWANECKVIPSSPHWAWDLKSCSSNL